MSINVNGTSLVGYITTTYYKLIEVLGEPHFEGDGDKTTCEWRLKSPDGVVATVYDWKEDETPMYEYDWHIGGHDQKAVLYVKSLFDKAGIQANVKVGW